MKKGTIILRTEEITQINVQKTSNYKFTLWKPSINSFIPPGKGLKYIIYWFFHFIGIFKSKKYSAVLVYDDNKLISSLLIIPTYFKWSFMNDNDIQFTYIMTVKEYRGKGLAIQMINFGTRYLDHVNHYWYVTNKNNTPSIGLAKKAGFKFYMEN